jgi:hypothetical protein
MAYGNIRKPFLFLHQDCITPHSHIIRISRRGMDRIHNPDIRIGFLACRALDKSSHAQ